MPSAKAIDLDITVTLATSADVTLTTELVEVAVNNYVSEYRSKLGGELIPSQITALIGQISGVYDVDLGDFTKQTANKNEYFVITPTLTVEAKAKAKT